MMPKIVLCFVWFTLHGLSFQQLHMHIVLHFDTSNSTVTEKTAFN